MEMSDSQKNTRETDRTNPQHSQGYLSSRENRDNVELENYDFEFEREEKMNITFGKLL